MDFFEEGELLYSKRFPEVDLDTICRQQGVKSSPEPSVPFESFRKHLAEDSTYIALPEKEKSQQTFIDKAIEFSVAYDVNMDIKKHSHYISVKAYLDSTTISGEPKTMFAELLTMCDSISFFTIKTDPGDVTFILDYYTHEHYLSGRKVNY